MQTAEEQTRENNTGVIPAALNSGAGQAGIHVALLEKEKEKWIPAFAGMTPI